MQSEEILKVTAVRSAFDKLASHEAVFNRDPYAFGAYKRLDDARQVVAKAIKDAVGEKQPVRVYYNPSMNAAFNELDRAEIAFQKSQQTPADWNKVVVARRGLIDSALAPEEPRNEKKRAASEDGAGPAPKQAKEKVVIDISDEPGPAPKPAVAAGNVVDLSLEADE